MLWNKAHREHNRNKTILCYWNLWLDTFCFSISNPVLHKKLTVMLPKTSSMFHGDLPQFPLPCNTLCNYRRTKTMQCFDWSKDVESFSLQSPRDPTTDQWKTFILLFPLHLHPLGFAVLWISVACILPLLRSCLWTSIVSEGKNKMLTKAATPWHFLPLREANAGQRRREQLILSVHPGELSPNHETKENSKATSRSYYWLPQLWIRGRDKPSLKTVTQPKPNSMRPFSLWCAWKQDKGTTLNTGTSSPLEYQKRCWSWGQISCSCWHRLASVKAGWAWKQDFCHMPKHQRTVFYYGFQSIRLHNFAGMHTDCVQTLPPGSM